MNHGDPLLHEVRAEDVFDALCAARESWEPPLGEAPSDFTWGLRGGVWTAAHRGSPFDSFRSQAKHNDARAFCARFHLTPTATFSIAWYGMEGARPLSSAWCHKMQWWYDRYVCEGEGLDTSAAVQSLYSEPRDLAIMFSSGGARARDRIVALRELLPAAV